MIIRLRGSPSPRVVQLALLIILAAAAVLLANGEAGEQVAADADVILEAEGVLQSATVSRSSVNAAVLMAEAWEQGLVGRAELESSADALRESMSTLETGVAELAVAIEDGSAAMEAFASISTQAERVAVAVGSGNAMAALDAAGEELDRAYETLFEAASDVSSEYRGRVDAVREGLGDVVTASRFAVALVIPAIALLFLYLGLRRRQRESLVTAELKREKALRHKKDQFLAGAAHQINTPLSVVLGFAEMLRENGRDYNAAVRTEMTELLAIQAAEASHVVEDILIAGRADMGELTLQETSIDVRSVIEAVTRSWSSDHRARLTVTGNGVATGDVKRVSQVVRNLLRNAVGHGGSSVDVEISQLFNRVLVEVRDDGDGIPEGQEEKIFQAYHTENAVDGMPPSLGLGLFVSRRLARAMHGDLKYKRENGVTAFEFSLPRSYELSPVELPDVDIDPTMGEPTPNDIAEMVQFGGPTVVYQPIVNLGGYESGGDCVIGYEALSRFPFGDPPAWFKAAKASGGQLDLELSCIEAAIDQFTSDRPDQFLTVNLSDAVLVSSRLIDSIQGISPGRLVLELSEQASISSYEATAGVIGALAQKGVRLAIDDIGAAEIDLWHVIRLSASMVKIDMSLIREVGESPAARGLIRSLVALADELGVMVVAEGVESEFEHRRLLELGVEFGQGYLYGKPGPIDQTRTPDAAANASSGV